MPKLEGSIKDESKQPFSGMILLTDMNSRVSTFPVKEGKPDEEINLKPGSYTLQMIPEKRKQSSYPQYAVTIPGKENVKFDELELKQVV